MATVRSNANEVDDFHEQMKAILPRLRLYALSLTHDRDRANDLVQETVMKALAGRASFRPGTNFSGWIFRIQRNEFISGLRRQKPTVPIDTTVAESLTQRPSQENGLVMREFLRAFAQLSPGQREALVLAVVDGQPYDVIAAHVGVSIGTIKSRVSRARASLARLLLDPEDSQEALDSAVRTVARNKGATSEEEDARSSLSP
jgi:RNA polymerase sigma-70 factor (ECF subfamily)